MPVEVIRHRVHLKRIRESGDSLELQAQASGVDDENIHIALAILAGDSAHSLVN
jgi:hypothetical protein